MVGINQVLKICWEIVNKSRNINNDNDGQTVTMTDNKIVLQALALINDCHIANSQSNLNVIDRNRDSVVDNFILERILSDISDIDINPITNAVYLTSFKDNSIVVINGTRDNIFAEAAKTHQAGYSSGINPMGSQPTDLDVNPVNNILYVANFGSNTITAIDGNNDSIISSHTTDDPPYKIALNPSLNAIYILKPYSNSLSVFDGSMKTMKKNFIVGMNSTDPDDLFINPTNGEVYVTNSDSTQGLTITELLVKNATTSITIIDGRINNKTVPIQRARSCKFCTDYKGDPKPILPQDLQYAIRMPSGDYNCLTSGRRNTR